MMWLSIMVVLAIISILLGIITVYIIHKRKKNGTLGETNYYAFFIIGICFLPLGSLSFILDNPGMFGLTALGICYMAIGLAHRDTWDKGEIGVSPL